MAPPCRGDWRRTSYPLIHGELDQAIEYLSLTTMMETFAASYASGAFFLNDEGTLDMDDDAHRILARQHNPGVTEWQD